MQRRRHFLDLGKHFLCEQAQALFGILAWHFAEMRNHGDLRIGAELLPFLDPLDDYVGRADEQAGFNKSADAVRAMNQVLADSNLI